MLCSILHVQTLYNVSATGACLVATVCQCSRITVQTHTQQHEHPHPLISLSLPSALLYKCLKHSHIEQHQIFEEHKFHVFFFMIWPPIMNIKHAKFFFTWHRLQCHLHSAKFFLQMFQIAHLQKNFTLNIWCYMVYILRKLPRAYHQIFLWCVDGQNAMRGILFSSNCWHRKNMKHRMYLFFKFGGSL